MLSDEEIKVMDSLKVISEYAGDNYLAKEHRRKLKLLIELVEKQQKEIEELKEEKGYHLGFIDGGIAKRYEMEDKIKAKIEEYKKQIEKDRKEIKESVLRSVVISDKEERIQELQSLLEKE